MKEEIAGVIEALGDVVVQDFGPRQFHVGYLHGVEAVAVFSRYGKVAAASTVTQLIAAFPVTELIFTGVAGAARPDLGIGDVVIADSLIQHDMDVRPLFPRFEIPLLGKARLLPDRNLSLRLETAAEAFLRYDLRSLVAAAELDHFGMDGPRVVRGLVASGDRFFAASEDIAQLRNALPEVACVEMEGAAVAQVCDEYAVPYAVVRTVSDSADEDSVHDFPRFAREVAHHYGAGILSRFVR